MVWLGELIEHGIKTKKLEVLKSLLGIELVEKDGKTEVVFSNQQHGGHTPYLTNSPHYPIINNARSMRTTNLGVTLQPNQSQSSIQSINQGPKLKKEKYRLDPILMTYTKLFPYLCKSSCQVGCPKTSDTTFPKMVLSQCTL